MVYIIIHITRNLDIVKANNIFMKLNHIIYVNQYECNYNDIPLELNFF